MGRTEVILFQNLTFDKVPSFSYIFEKKKKKSEMTRIMNQ